MSITEKIKTNLAHGQEIIKTNLAHGQELVASGVEGAAEARKAVLESPETTDIVKEAAQESWQAAAIGVMAGAIVGVLTDDRKPVRGVVTGGLLGAVLGFAGSFAWKTRPLTSSMLHGAGKRILADFQRLEKLFQQDIAGMRVGQQILSRGNRRCGHQQHLLPTSQSKCATGH